MKCQESFDFASERPSEARTEWLHGYMLCDPHNRCVINVAGLEFSAELVVRQYIVAFVSPYANKLWRQLKQTGGRYTLNVKLCIPRDEWYGVVGGLLSSSSSYPIKREGRSRPEEYCDGAPIPILFKPYLKVRGAKQHRKLFTEITEFFTVEDLFDAMDVSTDQGHPLHPLCADFFLRRKACKKSV